MGFSAEFEAGPVKTSMDAGVAYELNEEFVSSIDKTYTTTFEANDQNQVILRQTLMYYYAYDVGVYNKDTKKIEFSQNALVVSAPQYPVLTSVSMDQYNELATAYNKKVDESIDSNIEKEHKMALITDALKEKYFLNNEGNPFAYASSADKYTYNGIPGWDLSKAEVGANDTWMKLSHAGGTQTQTYSVTLEEEKTKSVAEGCFANMTVMVGGGVGSFSAYAGVTAGYERLKGNSFSKASITSTETSGTVQNLSADLTNYGFNWKLIGWKTTDMLPGVPFVGYAVKDQTDLPQPVDDLKATYADGTVTLTFTAPTTDTGRMAATHFYAYDDQHDGYIGACSNSSTDRSITIDVSGYTTQGATFTVIPYNENTNMRGVPSNEVLCLFVMSDKDVNALVQELKKSIADLETALKAGDTDLAGKIADLVTKYQALSEVADALGETMTEADEALQDAIDKVNDDLTAAIENLSSDTDTAIADLTAAYLAADALLKADIDSLSDKRDALEKTMEEADGALQEAIDKVNEDLSTAIENLREATKEELEQSIADLTDAYNNANDLLKLDIDSLNENLAALGQTMLKADEALQTTIKKVESDIATAKKELLNAMEEDAEQLNNRITTLNSALEAAYKLADDMLQKSIDGLSQRLDELGVKHQEDIDALREEIEALKAQIEEQEKVNGTQQEKMDTTRIITVVGLSVGAVSLVGNIALLIALLKKKLLTRF